MKAELHWLTANEIRQAYAARSLSPVELVQALLERISAVDDRVHAFIEVDAEAALQVAAVAEKEIASGTTCGPLHGIPVAIKDIIDVAGKRTTCHSKILLDNIASRDAAVISQLRTAGAIILGKLAMHEFATGHATFDLPFPPARNPWELGHHPGGSSSGSGAALAAGLTPLALGTDTGGSVRSPAAACGVMGLKPTYGAVSLDGVTPLAPSLDHVGPMARCVDDIAMLFDAITERATRGAGAHGDITGMRVGFVRHFHEQDFDADPEVAAALEEVSRVLTEQGAHVRTTVLPPLQAFSSAQRTVMLAESWAVHADRLRSRQRRVVRARIYGQAAAQLNAALSPCEE